MQTGLHAADGFGDSNLRAATETAVRGTTDFSGDVVVHHVTFFELSGFNLGHYMMRVSATLQ